MKVQIRVGATLRTASVRVRGARRRRRRRRRRRVRSYQTLVTGVRDAAEEDVPRHAAIVWRARAKASAARCSRITTSRGCDFDFDRWEVGLAVAVRFTGAFQYIDRTVGRVWNIARPKGTDGAARCHSTGEQNGQPGVSFSWLWGQLALALVFGGSGVRGGW